MTLISTRSVTFHGAGELPDHVEEAIEVLHNEVIVLHGSPLYAHTTSLYDHAWFIETAIRRKLCTHVAGAWTLEIAFHTAGCPIPGSKVLGNRRIVLLRDHTPFSDGARASSNKAQISRLHAPADFRELVRKKDIAGIECNMVIIALLTVVLAFVVFERLGGFGHICEEPTP